MQDLKGKVALVTGASRGIGRHIALQLAQRGADVAINYRSRQSEGDEVAREIEATGVRALSFKADLSKMPEARSLVRQVHDQWGRIDILVNNAGITKDKSMKKLTDDDWNDVLDTNLGSVYATCSEVLKIMMDQKYGRIINITSFVGQAGNFGQANYAASKGGIIAFTKTLRSKWPNTTSPSMPLPRASPKPKCWPRFLKISANRSLPGFRWGVSANRRKLPAPWFSWPQRGITSLASRSM